MNEMTNALNTTVKQYQSKCMLQRMHFHRLEHVIWDDRDGSNEPEKNVKSTELWYSSFTVGFYVSTVWNWLNAKWLRAFTCKRLCESLHTMTIGEILGLHSDLIAQYHIHNIMEFIQRQHQLQIEAFQMLYWLEWNVKIM